MSDDIISNFFYDPSLPSYLFINKYPVFAILWNLFLLMIPFLIYLGLLKYYNLTKLQKISEKAFFGFLLFLWLIFVPNSAYIITDVRHLIGSCSDSIYRVCVDTTWMIMVFFSYALIGWIFFVYLLSRMRVLLGAIFNSKIANYFIISIIPLVSLGVLLGLVNRWNSWEIFYFPEMIIKDALLYVTDWRYFVNFAVFTVFFYILYYLGSFLFKEKLL